MHVLVRFVQPISSSFVIFLAAWIASGFGPACFSGSRAGRWGAVPVSSCSFINLAPQLVVFALMNLCSWVSDMFLVQLRLMEGPLVMF